jgi:hypothetical protein
LTSPHQIPTRPIVILPCNVFIGSSNKPHSEWLLDPDLHACLTSNIQVTYLGHPNALLFSTTVQRGLHETHTCPIFCSSYDSTFSGHFCLKQIAVYIGATLNSFLISCYWLSCSRNPIVTEPKVALPCS